MEKIDMDALEDRRVYRIRSRNLLVGAWRAEVKGFIGIREKFGSEYLFTEYHHDADPHVGTVSAMEPLDVVVPEEIELVEGFSVCKTCNQPDQWVRENPPNAAPGHWAHHNGDVSHEVRPVLRTNQALFDLLKWAEVEVL